MWPDGTPLVKTTVFSPATKSPSRSSPGSGVSSGGNSTNGKARRANSRNNNSPNLLGRETDRITERRTAKVNIINRTCGGGKEVMGHLFRSLSGMLVWGDFHWWCPQYVWIFRHPPSSLLHFHARSLTGCPNFVCLLFPLTVLPLAWTSLMEAP